MDWTFRIVVLVLCAGTGGCLYAPNPADDLIRCSTQGKPCPDGYYCAADLRCWKEGHAFIAGDSGVD
jgi:hypothetical protein